MLPCGNFDGIRATECANHTCVEKRVVRRHIECVRERTQVVLGGHPLPAPSREIELPRVAPERLPAIIKKVLVEVRHGEFADRAIDRLAVPEHRVVRLRNCPPASVPPEECDDVVIVVRRGLEVEDERPLAVVLERRSGEERAIETVGDAIAEHAAWGAVSVIEADCDGVEEILNRRGRSQPLEDRAFGCVEWDVGVQELAHSAHIGIHHLTALRAFRTLAWWDAVPIPSYRTFRLEASMQEPEDRLSIVYALGAIAALTGGALMCVGLPAIGMLPILGFLAWCWRMIDRIIPPERTTVPVRPPRPPP